MLNISLLKKFSAIAILLIPAVCNAKPVDPIWIADHVQIEPSKSFELPYQFPSNEYLLSCYSEYSNIYDTYISPVEWTYKGHTYSTQIGYPDFRATVPGLPFTLATDHMPKEWYHVKGYLVADEAGKITFTNTNASAIRVSCALVVGPEDLFTESFSMRK
jgi:hypothetical protein